MKLRAEHIKKKYGTRTVVKGVSIEVSQGEIVGLLGPNGAGKTTSFYMIVGLIRPNEGHIYLDKKDITALPMYKRAQLGIGYLPQEASIFRKLSVEDNILAVLEMVGANKQEQHRKLESLLDEFGLQHVRTNRGDLLSGGERRRTEIARCLAVDPHFILLDEPFAGVDPIAVEDIQEIVARLKTKNIGILITDHNVHETLRITDRAYLLFEGDILKAGTAEDLANDEQVRRVYLGQNFELRKTSGKSADGIEAQLERYEPYELAIMYHYMYPTYSSATQEKIDLFLKRKNLNQSALAAIYKEGSSNPIPISDKNCPRCGSTKLIIEKVQFYRTKKYDSMDGYLSGELPLADKVICQVCGLTISDPNE